MFLRLLLLSERLNSKVRNISMSGKLAGVLFFGLAIASAAICAQEARVADTIKIETRLVSVPTIVSDRSGRYIPNLTQSDFTVFQDGVQQDIEFFAATEEPITVALLIDTSQSTRPVLDDIKDSAKAFIKLLTPKDKAMIVAFDYDTHILCQLTSDQEQLKRALKQAKVPDRGLFGTLMRDAVYQTINGAFRGLTGRKAIILLTDGKDVDSRIDPGDLLYRVEESDTLVYTVMFKTEERVARRSLDRFPGGGGRGGIFGGRFPPIQRPDPRNDRRGDRMDEQNRRAEEFLQELSNRTAGRFYSSLNGRLKNTFDSIVEELRSQYRLGFYPPDETGERSLHELRVKVSRPDTVVRSRESYRTQK